MSIERRRLLIGLSSLTFGAAASPALARTQTVDDVPLRLNGVWRQGGFAMGATAPRAMIFVDGEALTTASEDGLFIIGFDRDGSTGAEVEARWTSPSGQVRKASRRLEIAAGEFPSSHINGLPPSTVDPVDPILVARIREETALKAEGFASRADNAGFRDGFVWPLETYRISSAWGSQRVLNGTPARPHYGVDMAAPVGSLIRAPADGVVCFSRSGLHFEGGMIMIDHGQGWISVYLHQSRLEAAVGQFVRRGDAIGRVGATGRATGPHLCWRLKWRDRNMDPSLLIGASAPV